ncbi:hypothetical protein ACMFWY_01250 [Roseiconus sp. JC912]|uniref:hypothetical protein n=1 Tax=Roseiconus sp. JC912 TaxID=3396307 RepID=UPI003A4C7B20
MNLVRSFISIFLVALFAVSIAGWFWAGGQPSPQSIGSRVVLVLCGLLSVGCFTLLWSAKPGTAEEMISPTAHQS